MPTHREICFEHYDRECDNCSSTGDIEVHHIDGNPSNNDPGNLLPLCGTCHYKVHNEEGELPELTQKLGSGYVQRVPDRVDIDPLIERYGAKKATRLSEWHKLQQDTGGGLTLRVPQTVVNELNLIPSDQVLIFTDCENPSEMRVFLPSGRVESSFAPQEQEGLFG